MLTGGHISISYLLAEGARSFGFPITSNEIAQIIISGNVMDIDFLVGLVTGKTGEAHHQNITHTPLGAILLWGFLFLVFQPSFIVSLFFLISLFLHLVFDDLGYWMYKLILYNTPTNPQINWLYPLTTFHKNKLIKGNKEVLIFYLFKAWPVALLELLLILVAIIVYIC